MEQVLSQNLEIRDLDLGNKAMFPYSSLGAGLFYMLLYSIYLAI